jgi:hypothetical protein
VEPSGGASASHWTHVSTTDPDARLYRKGPGKEAKLCFIGHALMENRHSVLVDACPTPADGHAEGVAALAMIEPRADRPRAITLGADKAYDAEDFVNELRSMTVTPLVAQNTSGRSSAIDARTTRHGGCSAVAAASGGPSPLLPPPTIWLDCRSSSRKGVDGKVPAFEPPPDAAGPQGVRGFSAQGTPRRIAVRQSLIVRARRRFVITRP